MKRSAVALMLAALAIIAAAWGIGSRRSQPIASQDVAQVTPAGIPTPPAGTQVRVEQQRVQADVTRERARAASPRQRPGAARREAPPRKEGFFAKARRVLFGGGRHKPSPFPAAR